MNDDVRLFQETAQKLIDYDNANKDEECIILRQSERSITERK